MKTTTNKHKLSEVISYFVKGYKLKTKERIVDYEYYVDPFKGTVIIELTTKNVKP